MPKRKANRDIENESTITKIELDIDLKKDFLESADIEIPDLSRINIDEIENTIFEAVKRNNFSNAKAKYLIIQMLKHPNVIEWFRNIFSSENPEFSLSYEPRVTRAAKRRYGDDAGTSSELSASLIGRLLLSVPTITSVDFDAEDCTDQDYSPDTDQSDSDGSSILTGDFVEESEIKPLSPYLTRSRIAVNDLQVDLIDDSMNLPDEEEVPICSDPKIEQSSNMDSFIHGNLSFEEMCNLMEVDADGQLYQEFKQSLNIDTPRYENFDEDPEFDVFAQIDDLDEDIFDDCRDDRSVKIPKSELWALLKDNNLVDGNENSSTNKKTITMLYDNDAIVETEPCSEVKSLLGCGNNSMELSSDQRTRLTRQSSMFYQLLATNFIMLYDQAHFSRLVAAQIDLYFKLASNIVEGSIESNVLDPPNRVIVENILLNYKGMNYLPAGRFNKNVCHKKVEFPKCIIATLLCSSAFPYKELLPTSFKIYNSMSTVLLRPTPFLPSEDKLLTLGIIEFGHQSHKMLKLIHKYLMPIRNSEQLRYRKTNILRRHKEIHDVGASLLADLLQFSSWYQDQRSTSSLKIKSDLSNIPFTHNSLWQRQFEWHLLPDVYLRFLKKTVPDQMLALGLCSREEYTRAKRPPAAVTSACKSVPEKQMQYCNWSSLPWEMERVNATSSDQKRPSMKTTLRKIVKDKSFPQYEIPKNSNFRKLLQKWNCYFEYKTKKNSPNTKKRKKATVNVGRDEVALRQAQKLIRKSRSILVKAKWKRVNMTKLKTQQSYAHYFRDDDTGKLFPGTVFRTRLEDLLQGKPQKSLRMLRFQDKCRLRDGDMFVDMFAPFSSHKDEDDLRLCRNLLNNMQALLSRDHYEQCLRRINDFCLDDLQSNAKVLGLMRYLLDIAKSQENCVDVYEDLLYLLTPQQALHLGCEIEYNRVKNINQLYTMTKSSKNCIRRRFWIRLCALMTNVYKGTCCMSKVVQYLTNSLKHNPYLQSLIAPLLNMWETPFPNFPETFANYNLLATNSLWNEWGPVHGQETDLWEYCTELSAPCKTVCECRCHDNTVPTTTTTTPTATATGKESTLTRHCGKCGLKVANGSVFLDEGKFHKRLMRVQFPPDTGPATATLDPESSRCNKTDLTTTSVTSSMSVLEYLRSKTLRPTSLYNRCISIKDIHVLEQVKNKTMFHGESQCANYMQILKDDEAAMDTELFREIMGQPRTVTNECNTDIIIPTFKGTVKLEMLTNDGPRKSELEVISKSENDANMTDYIDGDVTKCIDNRVRIGVDDCIDGRDNRVRMGVSDCIDSSDTRVRMGVSDCIDNRVRKCVDDGVSRSNDDCVTEWSKEENMILLTECQRSGPCWATFNHLQEAYFQNRSLVEIETHFNILFAQLLEYREQTCAK